MARTPPYITLFSMAFNALPHTTGLPLLDSQSDFLRARRANRAASIVGWLRRRRSRNRLRSLSHAATLAPGPARFEVVPLHAIVGTLEPTRNFDSKFRPASNLVRRRWERIALAHRKGDAVPPVMLRRQADGYYVVDGRHRVSVARALGYRDIDAWVSGPRSPVSAIAGVS
ncbi:MAG TPA: hypothetical protein VJ741_02065 [Solirubrobacteraceae bacterium]|nr:hypothetical protein [Solirubrobacteraceae bacterium]